MATPINAPMVGEIWHLSIEDLFQPVQEAPRLGGDGPFVINLSVSTAPIGVPAKSFAGCRDAHVYQIQVTEDGRTRFRLRLGPFATEDEADAILAEVRDTYPGALTATASDSDLRVIGTMQAKVDARQSKKTSQETPAPKAAAPIAMAPKPAAPIPAAPVAAAPAAPARVVAVPAAPTTVAPASVAAAPIAVAKVSEELDAEISVDIAWPTPELAIPRAAPPRALPEIFAAALKTAPAAQPPRDVALQWSLPELDIPLPTQASRAAKVAPTLTEVVAPVMKSAAPKTVAQAPLAVVAPVLTEAVVAKPRAHAPKPPASKISPPAAMAAPPIAPAPAAPPELSLAPTPGFTPMPAVTPPAAAAPIPGATPAPPVAARPTIPPPAAKPIAAAPAAPKHTAPIDNKAAPIANKPAPAATKPVQVAKKPAPVLTQSVASPSKAFAARLRQSIFNTSAAKLTSLQHVVVATAPVPAAREVKKLDRPLDSLESTQTMRALTPMELDDTEASRWFVIELAVADQAFDPDAVPNLDLFDEYRLYSVAGEDQGRVVHALRLGFFREEIGAVAVASYLGAYWDKPAIKRVSLAERERFADQRVEARKDVGATGKHAVIEITDELVARRRRTPKSSVSAKSSNHTLGH